MRAGVSILDMGAGVWMALGIVTALYERQRSGRGQRLDASLLQTGVMLMCYHLLYRQFTGVNPRPEGARHASVAPYGAFTTADGAIMIGISNDRLFRRFARRSIVPTGWMSRAIHPMPSAAAIAPAWRARSAICCEPRPPRTGSRSSTKTTCPTTPFKTLSRFCRIPNWRLSMRSPKSSFAARSRLFFPACRSHCHLLPPRRPDHRPSWASTAALFSAKPDIRTRPLMN